MVSVPAAFFLCAKALVLRQSTVCETRAAPALKNIR